MKKTVAIICPDITRLGGIERVVCNFTGSLVRFGNYRPIIISLNSSDGAPLYELNPDVKLIHMGITPFKSLAKRVFSYFTAVKKISRVCRENGVEIILGTRESLNIILAFVKNGKMVRIACEHNIYAVTPFYTSFARKLVYRKLDAVVLLSESAAKRYTFCKNVKVIPNALSFVPRGKSTTENKVVISLGRFHKAKGFDLLIEAVSLIKDGCGGWVFRIFGEGEEYEDLVRLVREKKLEGIIEICPKTDNAEREYRGAGFYVLSSRRDTFPLVLLEAKSCGLPVVSFNCPEGPAHIVQDGVDGILVEDGNVKALSQAILKMIEEPETRKRYGREAAEDALRRFSPESVFEMWEELFAGLIGKE